MKTFTLTLALLLALLAPSYGKGGHSAGHPNGSHHSARTGTKRTYSAQRSYKHAHRSRAARAEFMRQHPCPSTGKGYGACPGYVVDHVKPLACGGADAPSNMNWQTIAEGKAKDKWERIGCK
jgi:hypothetical protein